MSIVMVLLAWIAVAIVAGPAVGGLLRRLAAQTEPLDLMTAPPVVDMAASASADAMTGPGAAR